MSFTRRAWTPEASLKPIAAGAAGIIGLTYLLVTGSPIAIAALGVAALAGLVVLRYPWTAYLLLVASVPAQQFVSIPIGGRIITLTQLSFLVALGATVVWLLTAKRPIQGSRVLVPLAALLVAMFVSIPGAVHFNAAGAEFARWLVTAFAFFLGLQFVPRLSEKRVTPFIVALALGGVFEAGFGVVQSVLALGPESFLLDSGVSRAFGTFGKPNTYAGFLEIVFFPTLAVGLYYLGRTRDSFVTYRIRRTEGVLNSATERRQLLLHTILVVLLLGSATLTLSGIGASLSRGAWLGVLVGLTVTGLIAFRAVRAGAIFGAPLIVLVLVSGGAGLLPAPIEDRLESGVEQFQLPNPVTEPITDENFATLERLAHWHAGFDMFEESPIVGIGVGNFDPRYDDFWVRQEFRFSRGHAHNYYIHTLAETGVAGFFAYAWLIGTILTVAFVTLARSPDGYQRAILLGSLGTVIAVAVHNLVENLHVLNLGITQAFLWSLIVVASRGTASEQDISA